MISLTSWFAWMCVIIVYSFTASPVTAQASPREREDVISQYTVSNERQCHRLCWYRLSCSSYSYNPDIKVSITDPTGRNCVLHSELGEFKNIIWGKI